MIAGESSRLQHLLRRTAFGYRTREWREWVQLGHKEAINKLVDYDALPETIAALPVDSQGNLVTADDPYALRRYWLLRILETSRPLEETMTVFWHGHFATSDYKVQNGNVEWRQIQTFRKYAMGNFRELIGAIAVDPSMLIWLDGNNSKKAAPNENFSRELLELFTMGVDGGYTEHDVKEGAKAYTGWTFDADRSQVSFRRNDFNDGDKTYLGHEGKWDIDHALDIVAAHPSTGRFISKKLFEFFAYDDPPKEELDRLSAVYFQSNYSIRELVRAVLMSTEFYSDKALYSRIKSPVQYAVMMCKTLDLPYQWINDMQNFTENMGQQLLNPPNVKGWKQGRSWINTNTMTARLNFATHVVDQLRYRGLMRGHITTALTAFNRDADKAFSQADTAVEAVWQWLLPDALMSEANQSTLVGYMNASAPKAPNSDYFWSRATGLVELVMTCPEYQLA
jgi:uncharacterized protein (DUF1800 family)